MLFYINNDDNNGKITKAQNDYINNDNMDNNNNDNEAYDDNNVYYNKNKILQL